jgi:hypothetical protein
MDINSSLWKRSLSRADDKGEDKSSPSVEEEAESTCPERSHPREQQASRTDGLYALDKSSGVTRCWQVDGESKRGHEAAATSELSRNERGEGKRGDDQQPRVHRKERRRGRVSEQVTNVIEVLGLVDDGWNGDERLKSVRRGLDRMKTERVVSLTTRERSSRNI